MESDNFEYSEFSINEILYMAHEGLTFVVQSYADPRTRDPFDIIAELEEHFGAPIIYYYGEGESEM